MDKLLYKDFIDKVNDACKNISIDAGRYGCTDIYKTAVLVKINTVLEDIKYTDERTGNVFQLISVHNTSYGNNYTYLAWENLATSESFGYFYFDTHFRRAKEPLTWTNKTKDVLKYKSITCECFSDDTDIIAFTTEVLKNELERRHQYQIREYRAIRENKDKIDMVVKALTEICQSEDVNFIVDRINKKLEENNCYKRVK